MCKDKKPFGNSSVFLPPMTALRPFKKYQTVELEIHDLAFEGKGISRVKTDNGDFIVFVPNTIPGQKVLAKMVKVKNSFAETKLLKVLEHSQLEMGSDYHPIPGAPYISLPVEKQHYYKRKTSIELFKRIGKIANPETLLDEFIPSPNYYHYRNKMEYSFSSVVYDPIEDREYKGFALGFKKRGQWLAVELLKGDSGLFDEQLENGMPQISEYFSSKGHTAWNSKTQEGFCRFFTVKKSFYSDSLLINLTTNSSELERFDSDDFKAFVQNLFGERLAGLVHTVNNDTSDRPKTSDGNQVILHGNDTIIEEVCGLKFKISLESFFQTNPASAERLYNKAMDYVFETRLGEKPIVMDLFSGTGTITQLLAQRSEGKEIIGVELVPEAVKDAKANAKMNGFDRLKFFAADVGKFILEHPQYQDKIGTIVIDPPRAGIAPKTLRKVLRLNPERLVYISCNPATQARDMVTLNEFGFDLKKYSLVDQFPHTAHIESVALFEKSSSKVPKDLD